MDTLFSCRNCIHNCAQGLNLGRGVGYCLQWNSLIRDPADTTCKYLHRKDLPRFLVEEGLEEHATEFLKFPTLASLSTKRPIPKERYSERIGWERGQFDPLILLAARYHRTDRAWVLIQTLSGRVDGRVSLAHSALMRRYMNQCGTWISSYRLVLALVREIDAKPRFDSADLVILEGDTAESVSDDAFWEVVFARFAAIQEYGWHAGLDELIWATDRVNGALVEFDWTSLQPELAAQRENWTALIIQHAMKEGEFFPRDQYGQTPDDRPDEAR
ncbi:MAG: hypothetical protein IAG10_34200 [Planctomycetaceae bacterium]|nr:hypothetical protein [Planctomycetaceae bacterium]